MKKNLKGFITIGIGVFCLIGSLLINRYADIDDVFCVVLMTFSLIIEVYGLFQIIKDTYNWTSQEKVDSLKRHLKPWFDFILNWGFII